MIFGSSMGRRLVRRVSRAPGFYVVGFVCLALAMGSAAAVFSVVDATLIRPLPYPDAGGLLSIASTSPGAAGEPQRYYLTATNVEALREGVEEVAIEAARFGSYAVRRGAEIERLTGARVTPGWFEVLGQAAVAGRTLVSADGGAARVAVVSDALWQRGWGGEASAVGATIEVDSEPYEIVGVIPRVDALPTDTDVWLPLDLAALPAATRRSGILLTIGRLGPGTELSVAQSQADLVAREQSRIDPEVNHGAGLELRPLRDGFVEDARGLLIALSVAVAVVMLIACLNVANLLLVRLRREAMDIAVRSVLGASGRTLLLGLLADSVLVAGAAVAVGLGLARALQPWLFGVAGLSGPGFVPPGLDSRVVAFGLFLVLITAAAFGLVPAVAAVRSRSTLVMRHSARTGVANRSSRRFQGALVGVQASLGLLLGLAASVTSRTFGELTVRDPGFETAGLATFRISASEARYPDLDAQAGFYRSVREATLSVPGVVAAGGTNTLPIGDPGAGWSFNVEHRIPEDAGSVEVARGRLITPGYFGSIGIPLVAGRDFEWSDRDGSLPVAIVSEVFARRYWPDGDALGRRIKRRTYDSPFPWMTIVGVVGDVRDSGLGEEIGATLYMPVAQVQSSTSAALSYVFRSDRDGSALIPQIRERVLDLDPDAPLFRVTTVESLVDESMAAQRFANRLMLAFAAIGAALLAAGLYSLLAWLVADRTHELGVRLAVGATRGRVIAMFVGQGVLLVGLGLAGGTLVGLGTVPLLADRIADPQPSLTAWLLISALLLLVAIFASLGPAWRAARLDPGVSLRTECC